MMCDQNLINLDILACIGWHHPEDLFKPGVSNSCLAGWMCHTLTAPILILAKGKSPDTSHYDNVMPRI